VRGSFLIGRAILRMRASGLGAGLRAMARGGWAINRAIRGSLLGGWKTVMEHTRMKMVAFVRVNL
jgi:hypothetical protein